MSSNIYNSFIGPCGNMNVKCPCMENGSCRFGFPFEFCPFTYEQEDSYPLYRRRKPFVNSRGTVVGSFTQRVKKQTSHTEPLTYSDFCFDNRWVRSCIIENVLTYIC